MTYETNIAEVPAPAKINLCLLAGPRREDGYHPVCSVMEKIRLFDTLRVMPEAEGTGIRLTGSNIVPAENIVMHAAQALENEIGRRLDVDIELKKEIPAAAGLAGGSSDAAAILKLLVFALGLEVPQERLEVLALELGADVPFFLSPGPQLTRGVGEILEPLPDLPDYALALVKPEIDLSTAKVYGLFDEMGGMEPGSAAGAGGAGGEAFEDRCRQLRDDLSRVTDAGSLASLLQNDLERPAGRLFGGLDALKEEIMDAGALGTLMSGSGSSVFGIFNRIEDAQTAATALRRPHRHVWAIKPFRIT